MNPIKDHWQKIYLEKPETSFSWYQPYPSFSIQLIQELKLPLSAKIIDIGGGDSHLVDALLDLGYTNLTVIDIAQAAIDRAKVRLGTKAFSVNWVVTDVLDFKPSGTFDLWHDRAAFHFLTHETSIAKYKQIASTSIAKNGTLILATFSENGPQKCSGLVIQQYSAIAMQKIFSPNFNLIKTAFHDHQTPSQSAQNFIYCNFLKT